MKKILITCCSTGFGYDSAKYLAEKGHHVYATLRTIAGLDFGFQALNDAAEPIRKSALESMGLADWDGPRAQTGKVI